MHAKTEPPTATRGDVAAKLEEFAADHQRASDMFREGHANQLSNQLAADVLRREAKRLRARKQKDRA